MSKEIPLVNPHSYGVTMMFSPKKIFVMRHAESLEDIDKTAYERIADEDMPLSDRGRTQVLEKLPFFIQEIGNCQHLQIFASPSHRVTETAETIASLTPPQLRRSIVVEPLIAKQNWGNVTIHNRSSIEKERYLAGVLRYRFPGGESGAEVLHRTDLFTQKLRAAASSKRRECFLIITHGFEFRVILKTMLGWSEEYFESLAHPRNCEVKRLVCTDGEFNLLDEMRVNDPSSNPNFIRRRTT